MDVRDYAFHLLYHQHGGSGVALSYDEIMNMELSEIQWWADKLNDRREAEADAIKKA